MEKASNIKLLVLAGSLRLAPSYFDMPMPGQPEVFLGRSHELLGTDRRLQPESAIASYATTSRAWSRSSARRERPRPASPSLPGVRVERESRALRGVQVSLSVPKLSAAAKAESGLRSAGVLRASSG